MARTSRLPVLYDYEDDPVQAPRVNTRIYDHTLRTPALPIYERWPVLIGWHNGAPVDQIADGLARGEHWVVGPAPMAVGKSAIWLRSLDVPYRDQIAAWRCRPML
jgi:hypothetical protein